MDGNERGHESRQTCYYQARFYLAESRAFQTHDRDVNKYSHDSNKCVYCDSGEHRTSNCDKVSAPAERKKILMQRRLCFNCAAGQ